VGIDKKYSENKIKTIKNVTFEIPAFTVLFVRNQEHVVKTQLIAEFSSISANRNQRIQANHDLNAELEGEVYFKNVIVHTQTKKEEILNRTTYNLGSNGSNRRNREKIIFVFIFVKNRNFRFKMKTKKIT